MDIRMPGIDGIAATRAIVTDPDLDVDVLILTTFDVDDDVLASLEAGAAGFLLKGADEDALLGAIRSVAAGEGTLDQRVTRRILHELSRRGTSGGSGSTDGETLLHPRSKESIKVGAADMGTGMDNDAGSGRAADCSSVEVALTTRELEVLSLLARGLSNGEMASYLYVEPTTIKYHLTGLMQKTGSRDRLQTVLWGIRAGLVHP
jgi:response regulator containing a cheY-like receiver domain and an HTH DNA-binding domain